MGPCLATGPLSKRDYVCVCVSGYCLSLCYRLVLRVNHSKNAIVKPQGKTPEMAQREVDEAMKKVREATMAIANAVVEQRELLGLVILLTFLKIRGRGHN